MPLLKFYALLILIIGWSKDPPIRCNHLSQFCNDVSITIPASSATEHCQLGGRSFNDENDCIVACGLIGKFITTNKNIKLVLG